MEPSCTKGARQEGGWDSISHLHVPCHPLDTMRLQEEPVMALPWGHTHPSLHDPDHQLWILPERQLPKSPCQQLYFKLLKDAEMHPSSSKPSLLCRLPPFSRFPPGWWAGSAEFHGQAPGTEQESRCLGDNEALTSPIPLPGLGAARGEGRKGSESP